MSAAKFNAFRDGRVHVQAKPCATCVFNPKTRPVEQVRVDGMVRASIRAGSAIICHKTLGTKENAVCRGFFNEHPTPPLQIAERLGRIEWHK